MASPPAPSAAHAEHAEAPNARALAGAFVLFFTLNLVLAWPTLRWPMVYDDLHIIRPLAGHELATAWHGDWDPDGLENSGLRPLTTLFNHARAVAFGENVLLHRVFDIGLFSLYVTGLVLLARRVAGTSARAALLGGLLLLANGKSVYHYVWLMEGMHLLAGLTFVAAAHLLLAGLRSRSSLPLLASCLLVVAGCLVREDTLVIVPALLLLGWFGMQGPPSPAVRMRLLRCAAGLLLASVLLIAWRDLAVPSAPRPSVELEGLLLRLASLVQPSGTASFDPVSRAFAVGGAVLLVFLLGALVVRGRPETRRACALWLACALLACGANPDVQRGDLFFFATGFFALACGTALDTVWQRVPRGGLLAAACAAWLVLGGVWSSRALAENFHPDSIQAVRWNGLILYGFGRKAVVPEARRTAAAAHLAALGIADRRDLARLPELQAQALAEGRRRPVAEGSEAPRIFVPRLLTDGF